MQCGDALWLPQVWYSVSPNDRAKFENMAQQLYPELAREPRSSRKLVQIRVKRRTLVDDTGVCIEIQRCGSKQAADA